MQIRITLTNQTRKAVQAWLQQAYKAGDIRLVRRIHALLGLARGESVAEVATTLGLGEQTVRDYFHAFVQRGVESLVYRRPPGRPAKLSKSQRQEIEQLIEAGPAAAGYTAGGWNWLMLADLIERRYGVCYHPHYLCNLLHQWGFSFQKARFVSEHLPAAARQQWLEETWPRLVRQARRSGALLLFGDEASFAQWGSLSRTWKSRRPAADCADLRQTACLQTLWAD